MYLKNVGILFSLLLLTNSVFADNTWTGYGKVLATYVDMRGTPGRILIKHESERNDECTNNGSYYHLDLGNPDSQFAYSLILSAEAKQQDIRMYYSGCSTAGYPVIKIVSTF